jgi:hypothetical protein
MAEQLLLHPPTNYAATRGALMIKYRRVSS